MPQWECKQHNQEEYNCFKLGEHETHVRRGAKPSLASSHKISIGSSLPVWHQLNGNVLESNGWKKTGNDYHKQGYVMTYNGVHFKIGQLRFRWIEEVNEYLSTGKLPEE